MRGLLIILTCFIGTALYAQKSPVRVIKSVKQKEVVKILQTENVTLIDVRTPEEYSVGHIHGAVNIDWFADDFDRQIAKYDRNSKIIVYCAAGGRSEEAMRRLDKLGFNYVLNLIGGYEEWPR